VTASVWMRIVGPYNEINLATEFHGIIMWLKFIGWRCDWRSWDEDVIEVLGMKMWLKFMECKFHWILWDENVRILWDENLTEFIWWKCVWISWDENL